MHSVFSIFTNYIYCAFLCYCVMSARPSQDSSPDSVLISILRALHMRVGALEKNVTLNIPMRHMNFIAPYLESVYRRFERHSIKAPYNHNGVTYNFGGWQLDRQRHWDNLRSDYRKLTGQGYVRGQKHEFEIVRRRKNGVIFIEICDMTTDDVSGELYSVEEISDTLNRLYPGVYVTGG